MGADLGHVCREHDGPAEHHLGTWCFAAQLPDAFLQDGVKDGWLADELPLHVHGAEAVLDLQDPAAFVHVAADGDDIADEALAHEVNAIQFPRDLAGRKQHIHIHSGGGVT